jgi:hypothetical protein
MRWQGEYDALRVDMKDSFEFSLRSMILTAIQNYNLKNFTTPRQLPATRKSNLYTLITWGNMDPKKGLK